MYYHRAMHYMNNQNLTLAIPDCDRAISLNPQYASAYLIRGFAYFGSGQKLVSACEDINKAIVLGARIDPNELQGIQQVCK